MGYRKHQACEAVLDEPGERDITAHVNFTALMEHARGCGFEVLRFENLARMLLRAGERDNFAGVLATGDEDQQMRRRLQLKTLLFGMGETFRTLLMEKGA
jgi:SAM-dependent MidA family methyltransferase